MFEGSYLGDDSRLENHARLECGICWWVHNPIAGDTVWQISPGTPFSALHEHWNCPEGDAPRHTFMVFEDE